MLKTIAHLLLLIAAFGVAGCERPSGQERSTSAGPPVLGRGIIRGNVMLLGPVPKMNTIANDACCEGAPPLKEETAVANADGSLRNVLVWIEGASRSDGSSRPASLLDQVHCQYIPHVSAVQVGQTLRVRSSDPTLHNVHFTPPRNPPGNFGMTTAGDERKLTFAAPEIVRFKCDVHPWMTAYVGVFDTPFFAVTGDSGAFEIASIPAGTYKLIAWHELYGRQEQAITVADDRPVQASFAFGKEQVSALNTRSPK